MTLFEDAGIKLYAVSYDEQAALQDYAAGQGVNFTLLSDPDSKVIREFGILNTLIPPEDAVYYGIPFPGTFLLDESGVVTDKLFHPHLATRDTAESIVDRVLGRTVQGPDDPAASYTEEDGIAITAFLRGGGGQLRIGPLRRLIVRFALPPGLHVYSEPVPQGMVAVRVEIDAPDGIRCEAQLSPPTKLLSLPGIEAPLHVWEGEVDFEVPFFGNSALARRFKESEAPSVELDISVHYEACDNSQCFIPKTRTLNLSIPLAKSLVPSFDKKERASATSIEMDSVAHYKALVARQSALKPGD